MVKRIALFVCCLVIPISCNSIEDDNWKYRDGFYVGDFMQFDSPVSLRNDTIFHNQTPKAVFVEIEERLLDKILVIKELDGSSLGYYCSK
ncbi:MAG: hypothetical protein ACI81T_003382 [Bacteroidia bacterium]